MNPIILKSIIVLLVAAALMAAGALIDHHLYVVPINATLDAQKGASAQASHDAIVAVQTQKESQDAATIQSANTYADTVKHVDNAISRMRKQPATHNECLPATPVSAGEPAASIIQSPGSCEDSGDEICTVSRAFFDGAIKDSVGLDGHAQWEDAQHFPISKD